MPVFSSHHSPFVLVLFVFSMSFRSAQAFFKKCFLSNLSFLFLSVISGLQLVVNPLFSHSWRHLLIIDLDTLTSPTVFFTWFDVVKLCFHGNNPVSHFSRVLWYLRHFLVLLSCSVDLLFLDLVSPNFFVLSLSHWQVYVFFFRPNDGLPHLHWHLSLGLIFKITVKIY